MSEPKLPNKLIKISENGKKQNTQKIYAGEIFNL